MAEQPARIFAIVPAAGRARRMGAPKQLLEIKGKPMLRAVLESLLTSQVVGAAVVTHGAIAKQVRLDDLRYVVLLINDDENSQMIDSVRMGIRAWRLRARISDDHGFLVCPADQPGISRADVDVCIAAFRETPDRIIIAARAGQRGHPIIFPASLARFVESPECDAGLHGLPRRHAERVRLVDCKSPGVTHDVDTPADYDRLEGA